MAYTRLLRIHSPPPPAQITTFYLWVRSLRSDSSWPFAIACGVAYIYMAPALSGLGAEPNQP